MKSSKFLKKIWARETNRAIPMKRWALYALASNKTPDYYDDLVKWAKRKGLA